MKIEKILMLFGYQPFLGVVGYSILSRLKGRFGYYNDVDRYATLHGLKRIKRKYLYESNNQLRGRILKSLRSIAGDG